jgi:hypothetical protein
METMITADQLSQAVDKVRESTERFVKRRFFEPGVLTILKRWIDSLPKTKAELSYEIGALAANQERPGGSTINGIALDAKREPSLEALVLHYESIESGLFPQEFVASARMKLATHGGPLYVGRWP